MKTTITSVLKDLKESNLLLESGVRIPPGTKKARILHHDDYDGIWSAIAIGLQLRKQGITDIVTDLLHDSDTHTDQSDKLSKKRPGEVLVVVDFDRFKDPQAADSVIDIHTDHHSSERDLEKERGSSHRSVGKTSFASDALHISSTKAMGFIDGTDLAIITGIDSAKFDGNVETNITLQRELAKNDGAQNKKMRLAIITSSILGQLIRSKKSRNPGAIQSIIQELIEQPSVINAYRIVKKYVSLQNEQVELIRAFKGKKSGEIDWKAIEEYNEKVSPVMRIGIRYNEKGEPIGIKKSPRTGTQAASSDEEISKKNMKEIEQNFERDEKGNLKLRAEVPGILLNKYKYLDAISPIPKKVRSNFWTKAKIELGDKNMSAVAKRVAELDVEYRKKNNIPQDPTILKVADNIVVSTHFATNRYEAYLDKTVATLIRDFGEFYQVSMAPEYEQRFREAAAAKGVDFKPEEIDLVELGKKSLQFAKDKVLTFDNVKRKMPFFSDDDVTKVFSKIEDAFKQTYEKSGGHASITNIDLKPIYQATVNSQSDIIKRIDKLESAEAKERLKELRKRSAALVKGFRSLMEEYKQEALSLFVKAIQGRINRTKNELVNTIKQRSI